MNTRPLEYYFSKKELLKILCRRRASLAKKEHDRLFHKRLLLKKGYQDIAHFYEIFPPRHKWIRLRKDERKGKNAVQINAIQLERTVLRATKKFKNKPRTEWQKKLYAYLDTLSSDILKSTYSVPKPKIIAQFKEIKKGQKNFRPIAHFELVDRIKISLISKYLTECFDITFENCSYAFRSSRILKKSFSHHSAVEDIINYKSRFLEKELWVAECDIRKFYDCVNHDVVRSVFKEKIDECEKLGLNIDIRAVEIFNSYLNCYSFNHDVLSIKLGPKKIFGWVKECELKLVGSSVKRDKIGVPQGGAISCLIANLLMDKVDKKVLAYDDGNLFYARFCDDMVLLHPTKSICEKALKLYSDELRNVKLLNHPYSQFKAYGNDFWKSKSKAPYKWAKPKFKEKQNVPWLSFVGYQVSYDLRVRVRKSSLKKEIEKQVRETGKVISKIKKGESFRVSEKSINRRVRNRLLSMSVGRKSIFDIGKTGTMCWTSGFRLLRQYPNIEFQTKYLDKKRVAQFARLQSHLKKMNESQRPPITRNAKKIEKEPRYFGSPFSYHFQFKK